MSDYEEAALSADDCDFSLLGALGISEDEDVEAFDGCRGSKRGLDVIGDDDDNEASLLTPAPSFICWCCDDADCCWILFDPNFLYEILI